jgi:enamine deaminase RidA (YjgF/YER057c/UK114 family)
VLDLLPVMKPISPRMSPTAQLQKLGIKLPQPWVLPPGFVANAQYVRVLGRRVTISGHMPIDDHGRFSGPYGRVGAEVTLDEARFCAERVMLGIFASLVRELGSLDRIGAWVRLFGMVVATPEFQDYPAVINGATELVYRVFGPEAGRHSRVAIAVAGLPLRAPVEIEAEAELRE